MFCLTEDFVSTDNFVTRITSSFYILRIDTRKITRKKATYSQTVFAEFFQLVAGKKSFDGENENKRPDVSHGQKLASDCHIIFFFSLFPFPSSSQYLAKPFVVLYPNPSACRFLSATILNYIKTIIMSSPRQIERGVWFVSVIVVSNRMFFFRKWWIQSPCDYFIPIQSLVVISYHIFPQNCTWD